MSTVTLVSFEQFEMLPETPGKQELLDGEIITMPPAKRVHMVTAHRLVKILREFLSRSPAHGQDSDLAFMETGYRMRHPDGWLQPDVSVKYPNQVEDDYFEGSPQLAVEVISESNTAEKMDRKVRRYFEAGATEVWVVYSISRSVWVYESAGSARRCEATLTSALFPGEEIALSTLF